MTTCRKRPRNYFRLDPQGLGDLDFADYMSQGIIVEITDDWSRSTDGNDATLAVYEKLKVVSTPSFRSLLIPKSLPKDDRRMEN